MVTKPEIGSTGWGTVLNTALDSLSGSITEVEGTANLSSELATAADAVAANAEAVANAAKTTADGKNNIYRQASAPVGGTYVVNDLWFDTDDGNKPYVWNGSSWITAQDAAIATAQAAANAANANANAAQVTADGKNKIYRQTSAPSGGTYVTGDLWFDTDDGNKPYQWNGSAWATAQDAAIATAQSAASAAATAAATAQTTADGKNRIYRQTSAPTGTFVVGDLWFDTDDGNKPYQWTGSVWTSAQDAAIATASAAAATAQTAANGKNKVYRQTAEPSGGTYVAGDLWFDTDDGNKLYAYSGSAWVSAQDTAIAAAASSASSASAAAAAAQTTADGKNKIYRQTSAPSGTFVVGDLWFDTDDGNKPYTWNGSAWTDSRDTTIATAQSAAVAAQTTADGKNKVFIQGTAPTATAVGDTWIDTASGHAIKTWTGTVWTIRQFGTGAFAAASITANEIASGAITTGKLAAGAVTANEIAAGAITTVKLAASAVTANEIAAGAITTGKIAALAITTATIDAGAITTAKIATDAITANEIAAGAVSTAELAAGAVTAAKITAGTITANEIATATITAAKIATDTITASNIAAGAITSSELATGSVTAGAITAGAVTAGKIDTAAVTSGTIAASAITSDKLAALSVIAGKIDTGAVTAGTIAAGAITAGKIAADAVTSTTIAADAVTATKIAASAVIAGKIDTGAVTAGTIAAGAVTTTKLAAGAVTANEIAAGAIVTAKLAAGAVTANEIAANTITAAKIAASTITATEIASNAITAAKIHTDAMTAKNYYSAASGTSRIVIGPSFSNTAIYWDVAGNGSTGNDARVTGGSLGQLYMMSGADSGFSNPSSITLDKTNVDIGYGSPAGDSSILMGANFISMAGGGTASIVLGTSSNRVEIAGNTGISGTLNTSGAIQSSYLQTTQGSGTANVNVAAGGTGGTLKQITPSTRRIKKDIGPLGPELSADKLYDLPIRQFMYKEGVVPEDDIRYNVLMPGLIAEEVAEIYPIVIEKDTEGLVYDWNPRYLVPAMLQLIQDQHARINALEAAVKIKKQ